MLDLMTGKVIHTLEGHTGLASNLCVKPDGTCAFSSYHDDHTLRFWDLNSGRALTSFGTDGPIHHIRLNHDGSIALVGDATGQVHFLGLENLN